MIDRRYIKNIKIPLLRRGQDFAIWLAILKDGNITYGINRSLGKYRRTCGSLSNNKFKAVKRTWYIYRKVEKLDLIKSLICLCGYAFFSIKKRIYIRYYSEILKQLFIKRDKFTQNE